MPQKTVWSKQSPRPLMRASIRCASSSARNAADTYSADSIGRGPQSEKQCPSVHEKTPRGSQDPRGVSTRKSTACMQWLGTESNRRHADFQVPCHVGGQRRTPEENARLGTAGSLSPAFTVPQSVSWRVHPKFLPTMTAFAARLERLGLRVGAPLREARGRRLAAPAHRPRRCAPYGRRRWKRRPRRGCSGWTRAGQLSSSTKRRGCTRGGSTTRSGRHPKDAGRGPCGDYERGTDRSPAPWVRRCRQRWTSAVATAPPAPP